MTSVAIALAVLGSPMAQAGYGDLDADGYPTWAARDLHLWTNAARVAPDAFESDYEAGGCSFEDFSADEQTPKAPLTYSRSLNDAAEFHTEDMVASGDFSHDSSDGTSFQSRLASYYTESGYVGENIAYGYGGGYNTVFVGWMCSTSGHRANIMSGDYTELGTGAMSDYYTQDFGAGTADSDSAVAMAVHSPERPSSSLTVYADWQDAEAPGRLELILDGLPTSMDLTWGTEELGIYAADADLDAVTGCHQYFIDWETTSGQTGRFPEEGSYTFGSECQDGVGWIDSQMCITGRDCRDAAELANGIELVGCASGGGRPGSWGVVWGAAVAVVLVVRRGRGGRA